MIEKRLELYLNKVGADLVVVLGSDDQQVQEWQKKLSDMGFIIVTVTPEEEDTYAHAVVLLDSNFRSEWSSSSWHTLICLSTDLTLETAHDLGYAASLSDTHVWNGVDFECISPVKNAEIDPFMMEHMWRTSIVPAWPDLERYRNDIYVLYAGAGQPQISDRRHQDILDEVKQAFIDGYTRIIFYNGDETVQAPSIMPCQRIVEFYDKMMSHTLPKNTFIYLCGAPDASQAYQRLTHHYNFSYAMMCRGYFRFELLHRESYRHLTACGTEEPELLEYFKTPYKIGKREKKFLNFNRVPRPHRKMIASKLKGANLLDQGYMSFELAYNVETSQEMFKQFFPFDDDNQEYLMDHVNFRHLCQEDLPMVLNRSEHRDNPVSLVADDVKYYANSYFSIVNETLFYLNDPMNMAPQFDATFLSEKAWKPLLMRHPFVIAARPGALDMLRGLGYRTFHPFINENYDGTVDDHTRMILLWKEIERLINLSDDKWIELQENIAPILEHNFNHFCNFNKRLYLDSDSIASHF